VTEQLTLAPVHAGDAAESRIAASRVDARRQLDLVLVCLLHSSEPLTDDAIAERCGLLRHAAGTRRGVAAKEGWVCKAGRGVSALGNPAATWSLTEAGRAVAERIAEASRAA
jgi:predicted ArsR family transcriptional regulator